MSDPGFKFEKSKEAADQNVAVLRLHNYDLEKAISYHHLSQLSFGSEFKSSSDLEELLKDHPLWPKLSEILDKGATFPLHEISSEERETDLLYHLERGNHKSSKKYKKAMDANIA
jgi:hypothetical protein